MSLESTLKTLLGPLVGGRLYADITPDGAAFPLIVYQQVGGRAMEYADQTIPDKEHARVQVMVWAKSRLEASQIARTARAAIIGNNWPAQTYAAPVSLYQEELKLYGSRTDYGLWYTP